MHGEGWGAVREEILQFAYDKEKLRRAKIARAQMPARKANKTV